MSTAMQLKVGPALMPDFMTGALFHAILAWPTHAERRTYNQVSSELMADVVRKTLPDNADITNELERDWPEHDWDAIAYIARKRRPAFGRLHARLRRRMVAAKIGIGLAHQEIFNRPAALGSLPRISIDELSRLVRSETTVDDPHNIENLVWRGSLPVIHLAMAVQLMLHGRYPDLTEFRCDLQDVEFYRDAVSLAADLRPLVLTHDKINVTREQLTEISWHE